MEHVAIDAFQTSMVERLKKRQALGAALAGAVALLIGACGSSPPLTAPDVPPLLGHPQHQVADVDLLSMTPGMRDFVDAHAKSQLFRNSGERGNSAWRLAYAALDNYLLDFDYDPLVTLPADRAFEERRGNCLTFSSMFIAMARDAGLEAWFQEVVVPPKWTSVNETLLISKHVNAVVQDRGRAYTVDVSRRKTEAFEQTRRLSDREAKAQYFNNLGADALIANNLALAHAYFSKAIATDPSVAYVWSNLGVTLRRNEQTADAVMAYRTALRYDPDQAVALNNLYAIYEEDGDLDAAAEMKRQVERNRKRNPYYLNYLAETAIEEQRYEDAIRLANRAIGIDEKEYRFHYTLAQSQYLAGRTRVARASLDRARELAPPDLPDGPLMLPGDGP
ncbi:MAG: tetratricopeptide repeat protein [Xanthomonadales bacterium]|nr:tetratricopeptide repeat protein [Xanthomonadales bacterium]